MSKKCPLCRDVKDFIKQNSENPDYAKYLWNKYASNGRKGSNEWILHLLAASPNNETWYLEYSYDSLCGNQLKLAHGILSTKHIFYEIDYRIGHLIRDYFSGRNKIVSANLSKDVWLYFMVIERVIPRSLRQQYQLLHNKSFYEFDEWRLKEMYHKESFDINFIDSGFLQNAETWKEVYDARIFFIMDGSGIIQDLANIVNEYVG